MCAQAESSSESEEEQVPIQRSNPGRQAHVLHDDDDESGPDSPAQPTSKRPRSGNAPGRKNTTVLNESDDDSDWEAPKRGAGGHHMHHVQPGNCLCCCNRAALWVQ